MGIFSPFLFIGDEHGTWSPCSLQTACICHFVFVSPTHSLLCVYAVWAHFQCGLEVLLIFIPVILDVGS